MRLLRQTLAGRPDRSVVIVQVGFSTNLARLLDSPADDVSPLKGRDLVAAKVRLLSLMAGAFAPIKGNAVFFSYDRPHAITRTLHGGAPVVRGEKWVATKWLREGEFV